MFDKNDICIIICNLQLDFIPSLINGQALIDSGCWLADLANSLDIPVVVLNHKRLGAPIDKLTQFSDNTQVHETIHFSVMDDDECLDMISKLNKKHLIFAGAETHITIFQSALELNKHDQHPVVIADASTSRNIVDHDTAIELLHHNHIPVITKEILFFNCLKNSEYPNYIDLSLKFLDKRYIRT